MIAHLKGLLAEKSVDHVILDVNGVGYQVFVSQIGISRLPETSQEASFHIYTHVREDQLTLFGFLTREEKTIFQRLLNVSGIGPKLAMTILSGLAPHDLVHAVVKEDLARISSIQGIGKRTAERIVVDLKDKFLKEFGSIGTGATAKPLYNDALSALVNLGYPRMTIEKVLAKIGIKEGSTVQSIVKESLKELKQ